MSNKLNETTGYKVAGLTADLMNKLRNNVISIAELETFLTLPVEERRKKFDIEKTETILRLISGSDVLKLDAVSGKETIADSKKVFSWIDGDFKSYGANTTSQATEETSIEVYEMAKDATFVKMFGSLNRDLDTITITQHQILNFIQKHKNWLRTEGYATFFLFKANEKFFVARVRFGVDVSLEVDVYRLGHDRVWYAEPRRRVVVPQLATS